MDVIWGALITGLFTVLAALIPVFTKLIPVNTEPSPVNSEPSPVNTEPSPVNTEPSPVNTEPSPVNTERPRAVSPRSKRWIQVFLGILIVVVASVVMAIYLIHVTTQSPQVTITSPGSSATPTEITAQSTIEGNASDLPHDQLFIVLRSRGGGLQYYPEAQASNWTGSDWSAALHALPGAGSYDLLAVAATTSEASGELRMYIEICQTTATACPGVDSIPEGVEILASVSVIIP